jgi:chromosomal replication initiation ATPase DnaA
MEEVSQVWATASRELEMQMTKGTYATWIQPSVLVSLEAAREGTRGVMCVPTIFVRDWMETRMDVVIRRTLGDVLGREVVEMSYLLKGEVDEVARGPP